jgi:hypothetical protein
MRGLVFRLIGMLRVRTRHCAMDAKAAFASRLPRLSKTGTPQTAKCEAGTFRPQVDFIGRAWPRRIENSASDDYIPAHCLAIIARLVNGGLPLIQVSD